MEGYPVAAHHPGMTRQPWSIAHSKPGPSAQIACPLRPELGDIWRLGGSSAQCEVFEDALLVGYLDSGQREEAHSLLRARLADRGIATVVSLFSALATVQDNVFAFATRPRLGLRQPPSSTQLDRWTP